MQIRDLKNESLTTIIDCFNRAFADYLIPVQVTEEQMGRRWEGARVDYGLSFGAFEGEQLVGFIIQGIDTLDGLKTAFNTGTGVIPEFRGQRFVQKIYDYALPILKEHQIQQCALEVICENTKAVKAYQNVGFTIGRKLQCFSGEVQVQNGTASSCQWEQMVDGNFKLYRPLELYAPSWDNSQSALDILAADYQIWHLSDQGSLKGYAMMNPQNGYLAQFGIDQNDLDYYGTILFAKLGQLVKVIRINNVDCQRTDVIDFLTRVGLKQTVSQYEMKMLL